MQVQDSLYENEKLFQRFFERKRESDWIETEDYIGIEINADPHMEMESIEKDNDYMIRANYKLSDYDRSVINTYFMNKETTAKIRNIIGEYLSNQPKRKIEKSTEIDEKDLKIGKSATAKIITQIWLSYISNQIEIQVWPEQCTDINKYLFDINLAEIIGVKSIKNELIELYNVLSKRIAVLYHQDRKLKVSSSHQSYLARSNYELLIQGYEEIMDIAFGPYKKLLELDLSSETFQESHEVALVYRMGMINWNGKNNFINRI